MHPGPAAPHFAVGVPSYELRSWEGDDITHPNPPFASYFLVEGWVELRLAGVSAQAGGFRPWRIPMLGAPHSLQCRCPLTRRPLCWSSATR